MNHTYSVIHHSVIPLYIYDRNLQKIHSCRMNPNARWPGLDKNSNVLSRLRYRRDNQCRSSFFPVRCNDRRGSIHPDGDNWMKKRKVCCRNHENNAERMFWSGEAPGRLVDDLNSLKAKLEMVEDIEQAVRTIEARVNALDDKLWSICDEEIEQEVQIQRLIDAKESDEKQTAGQFHYDTEILSYPNQMQRASPSSPRKSPSISEMRRKKEHAWDTYSTSFTVVLTKGYLQAVEQLRERMLVQEWDQNLQKIARSNGIARFEAYCASSRSIPIDYATIDTLYETNGRDLSCIQDEFLRMRCRSLIHQEEAKMKKECYDRVTEESRRLAKQFSEAEFLTKVLPDPIEHGLVSSVETLLAMFAHSMPS